MRISDWSSDVCSSDLRGAGGGQPGNRAAQRSSPLFRGRRPRPLRCAGREAAAPRKARRRRPAPFADGRVSRSEEHTSELQSLMRISYAVFCLKKKKSKLQKNTQNIYTNTTIKVNVTRQKNTRV